MAVVSPSPASTGSDAPADDGWVSTGAPPLAERHELDDLDHLSELTHPARSQIIRRLRNPRSAAELATEMDVPVTRLYHHLKRLEAAGIIRVVATRRVKAATERRYQLVARGFSIAPELAESTDNATLAITFGSLFDLAKIDFQRAVERVGPRMRDDEHMNLSLTSAEFTHAQITELAAKIVALLEEFDTPRASDPNDTERASDSNGADRTDVDGTAEHIPAALPSLFIAAHPDTAHDHTPHPPP